MPDGKKYKDWIKSKSRRQPGENIGFWPYRTGLCRIVHPKFGEFHFYEVG